MSKNNPRERTHTKTRFHRRCTWSRRIRWLIWTRWSVKSHISCRGNTRAAAAVAGLGCAAQPALQILSVSRRRPPWLREAGQQSRFLCVFQHWRRQRLPAHISAAAAVAAAPEGSPLSFHYREANRFFILQQGKKKQSPVWENSNRKDGQWFCKQRRNTVKVLYLFGCQLACALFCYASTDSKKRNTL